MKPGDVLAEKYRLVGKLGVGGMGQVWSAIHTQTDREFAIKVMHPHIADSQEARRRFTREAKASARINHPNVIDIFDVGELPNGSLYLVMELLDGLPLADAFFAQPSLTVRDFLSIVLDTAHALEAAHKVGVIHRDVKPANIYLHRDRVSGLACAKIVDFGISKFSAANDSVATNTGSVLGSPRYMSPEQTRSAASTDARSDVWALGVVLFEGLVGFWPHDGDSYSSLVVAIVTTPPKSIEEHAPQLPKALRELIHGCLQPIETRITTATEVAKRLAQLIEDGDLASLHLPAPQTKPGAVTTTDQISVKTPPPRTGLGARAPVDDEKTELHQQLPIANTPEEPADDEPADDEPADDEPAAEEDMPTGRVDITAEMAKVRASAPDLGPELARDSYLGQAPAPAPSQQSSPALVGLPPPPTPSAGARTHVETISLPSSEPYTPEGPANPAAFAGSAEVAAVGGALGANRAAHATMKLTPALAPAPLTETESKMNMAASQAPPPIPYLPQRKGLQPKTNRAMGLAAAVTAMAGIGIGWLVLTMTGGGETAIPAGDSAASEDSAADRSATSEPVGAPDEGGAATTSESVGEPEDPAGAVEDAPEVEPSAAASADVPPEAAPSASKPASSGGRSPGPRPTPRPPKPNIDDLGSGL